VRIFHIALEREWHKAQRTGEYTTSTLGRSLAEEGFIHTSRVDQVKAVHDRYYSGVRRSLVRLEIDTDELTSPWHEDPVGTDTYPHIYGPLNVTAVIAVRPWHRSGREKTFLEVFWGDAALRIALALVAMFLAVAGSVLGRSVDDDKGPFLGALLGLTVGIAVFMLALRRRGE
jgi:uncharacterized protein (DUF952 family)